MKKRIGKLAALCISAALFAGLLAGCQGKDGGSEGPPADKAAEQGETDVSAEDKADSGQKEDNTGEPAETTGDPDPITIAYVSSISTAQASTARFHHVETVAKAVGGEAVWVDCERTPDSMLNALEQAAVQGADAAILIPVADSMIPKIIDICEENEMHFGFLFRYANDPDIAAELEECPWYVGNCLVYSDPAVYASTSQMAEMGVKNLCIFGQAKGDVDGDARDAAAQRAADEHEMTILNEARALADASEATKVVESWISAYPEMDGILITATAVTPGITDAVITALEAHGKTDSVVLTIHDYVDGMAEAFDSGGLDLAYGGDNVIAIEYLAAMLANAAIGTPLCEEPFTCYVNYSVATSAADCDNYFEYVEGDVSPYTEEEVREYLIKWYQKDLTKEAFLKLAEEYSVEEIIERHGN